MTASDWTTGKEFIASVMSFFDVGTTMAHVAITTFSSDRSINPNVTLNPGMPDCAYGEEWNPAGCVCGVNATCGNATVPCRRAVLREFDGTENIVFYYNASRYGAGHCLGGIPRSGLQGSVRQDFNFTDTQTVH